MIATTLKDGEADLDYQVLPAGQVTKQDTDACEMLFRPSL